MPPYLLTDRDNISIIYRGPSICASYQVLVHLTERFQRRILIEIDQPETRNANGGHDCSWIGGGGRSEQSYKDFPLIFPISFLIIWSGGSEEETPM